MLLSSICRLVAECGGEAHVILCDGRLVLERLLLYATSGKYIISYMWSANANVNEELSSLLKYLEDVQAREARISEGKTIFMSSNRRDTVAVSIERAGNYVRVVAVSTFNMLLDFADPRAEVAVLEEDPLLSNKIPVPTVSADAVLTICTVATVPLRVTVEVCPSKRPVLKIYLPQLWGDIARVRVLASWADEDVYQRLLDYAHVLAERGVKVSEVRGIVCKTAVVDVLPPSTFALPHEINAVPII